MVALLHIISNRKISHRASRLRVFIGLLVIALLACIGAGWLFFYFFP